MRKTFLLPAGLAVLACVALILSLSNALPWLEGRLNGVFSSLLVKAACFVAWFLLLGCVFTTFAIRRTPRAKSPGRAVLPILAIAFLPWVILGFRGSPQDAFAAGFRSWASAQIDVSEVAAWRANLEMSPTTAPAPLWWPTQEYEMPLGAAVPPNRLSGLIAGLRPDDVRVFAGGSAVLFAWAGGRVGWVRFALVGQDTLEPPPEFREEHVRWEAAKEGVLIGIAEHH